MSVNKKYFYLKFKEDYFNQDHIKVIEAMSNGYEYSLIILKLYLKALKWEGQLRINESIPYMADKIDLLAGVLNHDPANVMHAINLAKDLGVIEILETGEIFMKDIHNFIGHGSTESERKAGYRKRLEEGKVKKRLPNKTKKGQCPGQVPPELELELEKDIEQIYKSYPTRCIISNRTLNRSDFKKEKIIKLIKKHNKEEIIEIIQLYINDCKKTNTYMKNFSTFINHFPNKQDFEEVKEKENKLGGGGEQNEEIYGEVDNQSWV